jgi:nicotinamidase-related amidase
MTTNRLFGDPFTANNTALVLVDHQAWTLAIVGDQPRQQLLDSVVGIAKAARVLQVPIVLTSASTSFMGPTLPELSDALADLPNIERTTLSAWDDQRVRDAVKATGRPKLLFGGIGTNVCLTQAAIPAANAGYQAYAGIDISGTATELMRQAAIAELMQAGVGVTTARSVILQILRDNADPRAQDVYAAFAPPPAHDG